MLTVCLSLDGHSWDCVLSIAKKTPLNPRHVVSVSVRYHHASQNFIHSKGWVQTRGKKYHLAVQKLQQAPVWRHRCPSSQLTCWDCEGGMGMEGGKSNCAAGSPVPRPCPIMPCEECCCEGAAALSSTDAWNRASATTPPERFCECERPAWAKLWLALLKSKFDCVKLCCDNDRGSWDSLSHDWSTIGGAGKPEGSKLVCGGWELTEGGRIMGWAATTAGSMCGAGTTSSWQVSPHTPPLLLSKQLNVYIYVWGGRKRPWTCVRTQVWVSVNVHAWLWVYTFENEHMASTCTRLRMCVCMYMWESDTYLTGF